MAGTARDLAQRLTRDARISLPRRETRCSTAEASTCVNPANRTIRREEVIYIHFVPISILAVVTARAPVRRPTRDARTSPPRRETRCSTAEASTCVNPANRTTRSEEAWVWDVVLTHHVTRFNRVSNSYNIGKNIQYMILGTV